MKSIKCFILILLCLFLTYCSTVRTIPNLSKGQEYKLAKALDLKGKNWILPEGAILVCASKGKIKNGIIVGQNSSVENLRVESVRFTGSFESISISLQDDVDSLLYGITGVRALRILGNGHLVRSTNFGLIRNVDVYFKDVMFDCSNCKDVFFYSIGNGMSTFVIEKCSFVNIPEIELLKPRNMLNPVIRGCVFNGLLNGGTRRKSTIVLNRFYGCKGDIVFEDNVVQDCYGVAVNGIEYSKKDEVTVSIKNNVIKNVSNGGIVFNGGEVTNIRVENNEISNVFCFGSQFDSEKGNAENAAINFHGFHDLHILNNTIRDCTNSLSLDLDGTASDGTQEKGTHLVCAGNVMKNVLQSYLFGVQGAEFFGNQIEIVDQPSATSAVSAITLNACHDVHLYNNIITLPKPKQTSAYPIVLRQNTNRTSGKINLHDNTIFSDSGVYLMIYNGFTGEVNADNNKATSTTSSAPLKWVNNSKSKGVRVKDKNVYR
ncbi:hypothetical protein [Butyricimonas paravirosa]|uniref:hypothetical protein n=1 Tax=Butyricimonas paravirosa TaxID=1472417 RepID=UPI00210B3690|nr:hypothetical protein [Butyricimonas paravirosa]MCQ4875178.1 hypothetical protein [Butyricimonas paravirosa]